MEGKNKLKLNQPMILKHLKEVCKLRDCSNRWDMIILYIYILTAES